MLLKRFISVDVEVKWFVLEELLGRKTLAIFQIEVYDIFTTRFSAIMHSLFWQCKVWTNTAGVK